MVFCNGRTTLSCVVGLALTLCYGDGCSYPVIVPKHQFEGKSAYSSDSELEECLDNTVQMEQIPEGLDLEANTETFHTLSLEIGVGESDSRERE